MQVHLSYNFIFGSLIAEEIEDLGEAWMKHADAVLCNEQLIARVYDALVQQHPDSLRRGRQVFLAEAVMCVRALKHESMQSGSEPGGCAIGRGYVVGEEAMQKLIWPLKLVAELELGVRDPTRRGSHEA
jgi:hypothetical protein